MSISLNVEVDLQDDYYLGIYRNSKVKDLEDDMVNYYFVDSFIDNDSKVYNLDKVFVNDIYNDVLELSNDMVSTINNVVHLNIYYFKENHEDHIAYYYPNYLNNVSYYDYFFVSTFGLYEKSSLPNPNKNYNSVNYHIYDFVNYNCN